MKYRITKIVHNKKNKKGVVEFSTLYDFGIFSEKDERALVPYKRKRGRCRLLLRRIFRSIGFAAYRVCCFANKKLSEIALKLREARERKKENKLILPALCGAFVAVTLVTLFSFSIVGYKLLYQNYFGSYKTVTVPDFSGAVYPSDALFSDLDYCNISVSYEYNDTVPAGAVISQTPEPNVVRRVYRKRSNCNVELAVSLGKKTHVMPDLKGETLRDARLALKNAGMKFTLTEAYSSEVEKGKVISTSPMPNETFYADRTVTVTVSLGEKKVMRRVPSVVGMNEGQARAAIESAGLSVGKVSYESSEEGYGIVLSQSLTPYSSAEDGTAVSFSVSAGQSFAQKVIPELSALTLDEAKERLYEVGLVIGRVYAVENAALSGTVVAQFPPAKTPITSDIYSVDVYVSS